MEALAITNPCKGVCKQHQQYKICLGCYRSRLEIMAWGNASDEKKLTILEAIKDRQAIYGELSQ